ncbi:DUF1985 domain-containing protein [Abeliophyllum distichum]|uniref:DUF1985 domain-containing protein n=1 Tax=Abeliophyllum distichum TaxID=126358 RepID=A0ABD1V5W4_9LAMI
MKFFLHKAQLSDREVFKCGLLLLLTNLFFTTAYKRSVEDSLMVLVDSDDMNTFAWGKDLFKFTLASLRSGLRNKYLIVEGDGKPYIAYKLNGFLIAFQIWIYETLPVLDGKICTKISHRCPRILNWTSNVQGNFLSRLNLGKDIFGRPNLEVISIKPTTDERLQLYTKGFYHDLQGLRVEDSDDDFASHVVRRSPRIMMKHTNVGCNISSFRLK